MDDSQRKHIISMLYDCYKAKGFVSENKALSLFDAQQVPLNEIDSITDHLLGLGVIIRSEDNDIDEYDRGQTDFGLLYRNAIKTDPSLEVFVNYVSHIQPPQHREWSRLIPQCKSGNTYAKKRLHEMYLRSVIKIAYSFHQRLGAPLADTIQDGSIGLMFAIEKYNIYENVVFPSYYPMWVVQNITRCMSFSPNPIFYFPVHIKDKLNRLYDNVKNEGGVGKANLSSSNLLQNVTDEMQCSVDEAKYYLAFFEPTFSIEEQLDEHEFFFSDYGFQVEDMMQAVDKFFLQNTLKELLAKLKPRESKVLELRYGLLDECERTLEEIGEQFGVTRERIRQIEAKAIRKLQHPARIKKLRPFFDSPIN